MRSVCASGRESSSLSVFALVPSASSFHFNRRGRERERGDDDDDKEEEEEWSSGGLTSPCDDGPRVFLLSHWELAPEVVNCSIGVGRTGVTDCFFVRVCVCVCVYPIAAFAVAAMVALPREAKALQEAKKRADQIGVGVTREAQRIFDSVNKTLPCEWKGKDIVVIGEVTIVAPYGVENCSVVAGAEKTLQQVVKVLSS